MVLVETDFSTRIIEAFKKWTLILVAITTSGVMSAYYIFFLKGNHLSTFIIASGWIYFTMITPIIPSLQKISQYERKNTIKKLENSVNKSPTFVIMTSIEDLKEVKGKIIDPYNPIYLKIRSGKRTLSIPWEKIEAIGEE
jgi:Na+/citrate or Na+/malate symporter